MNPYINYSSLDTLSLIENTVHLSQEPIPVTQYTKKNAKLTTSQHKPNTQSTQNATNHSSNLKTPSTNQLFFSLFKFSLKKIPLKLYTCRFTKHHRPQNKFTCKIPKPQWYYQQQNIKL